MRIGRTQTPQAREWIWNGAKPLYTMAMNSDGTINHLQAYGADGLGIIQGSLTVADSDFDGAIAQFHNSTGHSMWSASNPYNQFCQHASPLPASPNYVGPDASQPLPPADGTSDPSLTIESSGRAFLSKAMGFTTPDYSSSTPYASSSRRVLNISRRPVLDDPNCPGTGERYTDGDHECEPLSDLAVIGYVNHNIGMYQPGVGGGGSVGVPRGPNPQGAPPPPTAPPAVPDNCKVTRVSPHIGTYQGSQTMIVCPPFTPEQGHRLKCGALAILLGVGMEYLTRGRGTAGVRELMREVGVASFGASGSEMCENLAPPPPIAVADAFDG